MSMQRFFSKIWQSSKELPYLFFVPIFLLLRGAELIYRLGFWLVQSYHTILASPHRFKQAVISVGNLCVGGTGKSVVTRYLLTQLGEQKGGVVMRGYRGKNEQKKTPLLVSGWGTIHADVYDAGDEAAALSLVTSAPVVVGARKHLAGELLLSYAKKNNKTIEYLLLDDGYQSFGIARDADIVLLDARAPFGNNYCLPAGPLREKSLVRATHIIITHADDVSVEQRQALVAHIAEQKGMAFAAKRILCGIHAFAGIWHKGTEKTSSQALRTQRFYALAGIGLPDSFFSMLAKNNVKISKKAALSNHYDYSDRTVIALCRHGGPFVTTEKDWVKIQPILQRLNIPDDNWYVARVVFEPLGDHTNFIRSLLDLTGRDKLLTACTAGVP